MKVFFVLAWNKVKGPRQTDIPRRPRRDTVIWFVGHTGSLIVGHTDSHHQPKQQQHEEQKKNHFSAKATTTTIRSTATNLSETK